MLWRIEFMANDLSVIALAFSLVGNILINVKRRSGYVAWIISNLLWIAVNYLDHLNVPQVIMYVTYTILNFWGFLRWSKEDKK